MGPDGIVVHAPGLDDLARVRQAEEPVLVQALVAESAVETLDVGVRVALDQPESGPLGPRPGDFHSPLVELCRCVKTNPFWVSYRFLTGFLRGSSPA